LNDVESLGQLPLESTALLDVIVERATRGLFDSYGLDVGQARQSSSQPPPPRRPSLASIIDYTSPQLSGTVILAVPETIVLFTTPAQGAPPADWIAELANQLQGRIKNQFLVHGVSLTLGLPLVIGERGLEAPGDDGGVRFYEFETARGAIVLRLQIVFAPGFDFTEATETEGPPEEGELIFF